MVLLNYATKEIVAKIVYYGPGLCGKTTNLQYLYSRLNPKKRGKMISLATESDRTLFFDFLPLEMGVVQGFKVRFQLYTVPGQVFYSATRKVVLKGVDAVIFVADSQADLLGNNIESLEDMKKNLEENGLDPLTIPIVFQYNKRDLKDILETWILEESLNYRNAPFIEAAAVSGTGVMETFREVTRLLLNDLKKKHAMMNTGTLKDLPAEIFENPVEKRPVRPVAKLADEPDKSGINLSEVSFGEIELGSSLSEDDVMDVPAGAMLDDVETEIQTISLADATQAEAFFDNWRKGDSANRAKEKVLNAGRNNDQAPIEMSQANSSAPVFERPVPGGMVEEILSVPAIEDEFVIPELEPLDEYLPPPPNVEPVIKPQPDAVMPKKAERASSHKVEPVPPVVAPEPMPPAPKAGLLDENVPSLVEKVIVREIVSPVSDELLSGLNARLDRVEKMLESLGKTGKSGSVAATEGLTERLEKMEKSVVVAMEGQDRLLLSILEAVRDNKKVSAAAFDKIEDVLKVVADRMKDDKDKKRWF